MSPFITDDGMSIPAVTSAQMREVDRIAIEEAAPNLFQMMENAGRNLAQAAVELLGNDWRESRIVVCAGSGGNGGGAVCAARHLANHGGDVVLILSSPTRLSHAVDQQLQIFQRTPGRMGTTGSTEAALILDGLIGYGLDGAPSGATLEAIQWAKASGAPVIALDVPSGLDSTTGETPGDAIKATTTMTLALPKTGLVSHMAGELWLADIGIPSQTYEAAGIELAHPIFNGRYRIHLNRLSDDE